MRVRHCVIIGFANCDAPAKKIFDAQSVHVVPFINAYLLDAPNIIVLPQAKPLCDDVPPMIVGSNEFINGIMRYCLWLKNCPPNELHKIPFVMKWVEGVRDFRLTSKKVQTRRRADTPTLFAEDRFADATVLFVPQVSSENRQYVPIGNDTQTSKKSPPNLI